MRGLPAVLFSLICLSCNSPFTPKQKGYYRIDFPKHEYQPFQDPEYPYGFEYPLYGLITKDSTLFDDNPDNPYWINIDFPRFQGRIYVSYKTIGGTSRYKVQTSSGYKDSIIVNTFEGLREEAFKMTYKHTLKASSIRDSAFTMENGLSGVYFTVGGNAATAYQFFITDSVRHFLRGALYFDASPNADSLRPVHEFLQQDLKHLIRTFSWQNKR